MLVMVTEGGETKHRTNINFLLEEFGIMANSGEKGVREKEEGRDRGKKGGKGGKGGMRRRGEGEEGKECFCTLVPCSLQQMWSHGLPTTNIYTQKKLSSLTEC